MKNIILNPRATAAAAGLGDVTAVGVMRRRRGLGSAIVGLTLGLVLGFLMLNYRVISSTTTNLQHANGVNAGNMISNPERTLDNAISLKRRKNESFQESDRIQRSSKSLVFVGVMTAHKYLGTRAKAVYETWGKNLPGKIAFFSSEFSTVPENCPDLPLVTLPRVDDGYPPQKKSFLMLQYMWNHYGDQYEWFLRADDDVYVRTDKLEKLLRSVDSRKAMYIGQAGRGNSEEFGLLSLEYDENFCMGGPGVIMSRETLKRIVPHVKYCLKNLYTTHEDVELGRCVQKYAGIPCTWSYEMQSILYHNSSGDQAFTGNLKRKEVHRAITLHPVKSPPHMYRLHNYIRGLRIQDLQQERIRLHRDVSAMAKKLGMTVDDSKKRPLVKNLVLFPDKPESEDYPGDTEVLGIPPSLRCFKPRNSREVIPWDFYSRSEYSLGDSNPRRRIHSHIKEGLEDITREVMASINACSRQRGRIVEERSALYGYRRVDAYGADTILDLLLVYRKYRGRKVTLPVRRHVYLHQHFTGLEIREIVNDEEVDQHKRREDLERSRKSIFRGSFLNFKNNEIDPIRSKTIRFILPLSGRFAIFERFLKNYEEICLLTDERTELIIVLYHHKSENSYNNTIGLIDKMKNKYSNEKIKVVQGTGNFSRARALQLGVAESKDDDLLFFVDVDIVFTSSALNRIRLNTVFNRRIYFPVVFSQFDPNIVYGERKREESFVINDNTGYWRQFGFGIVSIFKQDYRTIGGFDLSINGWGKEDVDLFEKAIKSELNVFRAPDKNLIHVYHEVECDDSLSDTQLSMCRGTRADTYASTDTLAKIIYENPEYLRFAKNRRLRLTNTGG